MNSDEYKDCNHLLIYVSQDNEVDTIEIIKQALTDDKIVAVPKVYGDHMHFHRIHGMSDLKVGAYGILEPVGCDMLHPTVVKASDDALEEFCKDLRKQDRI